MAAEQEFLPPHVLERLGGLAAVHRYVVDGFVTGLHRSAFRGAGEEFDRHRSYQQGDDLRHIDWRLYGRTDRLYVREFREHSNLQAYLVVDASASMGYADEHGVTKLRYASFVAAALGYVMERAGDGVGLATYGDGGRLLVPPRNRRGHIHTLLVQLARLRPSGRGSAIEVLDHVGNSLPRRGRVMILSDLLEDDGENALLGAVGRLRARGDEVIVLRILTPAELGEKAPDAGIFFDPERPDEGVPAAPASDSGYRKRLNDFYGDLERRLREIGAEYVPLSTADPVERALAGWIRHRVRRGR